MNENLQKWQHYCKDVISPDTFIDAGFYYIISAALQRRVWVNPADNSPLFPNQYIIMVGDPGIGKGLVIKRVADILKYFKKRDIDTTDEAVEKDVINGYALTKQEQIDEQVVVATTDFVSSYGFSNKHDQIPIKEPPPLFPIAADATTYEALLRAMTKAMNKIMVPKDYMAPSGVYLYKSLAFCLEEISSIFRKNQDSVTKFLLNAFDCGDYDYETKHQGTDRLRKMCLNFFGGTTPRFMQDGFTNGMIDDGLAARTIFVFEFANRSHKFGISELTPEQRKCKADILNQTKRLARLYGRATYTPEAYEFLRDYFERILPAQGGRVNKSLKLNSYYVRKNIHVQKMAMAVHFADRTDMVINLEECQEALKILDKLEAKMHYALNFGENPLAAVSKRMLKHLKQVGPETELELLMEFTEDLKQTEFKECLNYLLATGLVRAVESTDQDGKRVKKFAFAARP